MNLPVKIASRSSPLALVQIDEIIKDLKAKGNVLTMNPLRSKQPGTRIKSHR